MVTKNDEDHEEKVGPRWRQENRSKRLQTVTDEKGQTGMVTKFWSWYGHGHGMITVTEPSQKRKIYSIVV